VHNDVTTIEIGEGVNFSVRQQDTVPCSLFLLAWQMDTEQAQTGTLS
jgi:hypothetical protein